VVITNRAINFDGSEQGVSMHEVSAMPERLAAFLSAHADGRTACVRAYEPIVGGYSRIMARADVEWSDGGRETIVLRGDPPPGKAMMETDRDKEYALLTVLERHVRMPRVRHYDATGEHLGTKCIVLEHVAGPSLQQLLDAVDPGDGYARHVTDLVDTVASLHTMDTSALVGVLEQPVDWDEYLGALIDRFRRADTEHVESVPFLRYVAGWLDAHRPPPLPLRLVHSDFQAANIMVGIEGAHHVIDWELAHIGDPREDLGYYNVYSSARGPNLYLADPDAFLTRYRERTGFDDDAVNAGTVEYFSSLAAVTVYAQVLKGAAAMAAGANAGLMTTYTLNALTVGHNNFMKGCA
jgi:aminoglycoside phosphotransferase (APT) family kinase protein